VEEGIPNRRLRDIRHKAQRRSGIGKKYLSLFLPFCLTCVPAIGQNQPRIVSKGANEMDGDQPCRHRAKQRRAEKWVAFMPARRE